MIDLHDVAALYPWLKSRVEPADRNTCYRLLMWADWNVDSIVEVDHVNTTTVVVWTANDRRGIGSVREGDLHVSIARAGRGKANSDLDEVRVDGPLAMVARIDENLKILGWEP